MKNQATTLLGLTASLLGTTQGCALDQIAARASQVARATTECDGSVAPVPSSFEITNVNVFTGTGFSGPQTVTVVNGKIASTAGAPFPGLTTVNGAGKYLIPGFVEGHVHPQACGDLSTLAEYGVTTAMNMACLNYTTCATLKGQAGKADYITAGEIACGVGSTHASIFGVPAAEQVGPNTDLSALVDYTFGNGSNFFKIIAEDKGPTVAQQQSLVKYTQQNHNALSVTHATLLEYYDQAIQSKTNGIQHSPADGLLSSAQIQQIVSQGQFVVPTMEFYRIVFSNPVALQLFSFSANSNYSNVQTNVANLHKAGVKIAAGTDSIGNFEVINLPFGVTLHCELQNLVQAGFGNAEAIQAATAGAASLYKLTDRGSIKVGQRADLILLNSSPITNISNTFDISAVWAGGIPIPNIQAKKGQTCDPTVIDILG